MINLLPEQNKKQFRAARANVLLRRYNVLLIAAAGFLIAAVGVAWVYLVSVEQLALSTIEDNQQRRQEYASTQQEATAFRTQLSDAKSMLDGQLSYGNALDYISALLPNGASVSSISLSESSFSSPLTLEVRLQNEAQAAALVQNMEQAEYVSGFSRGSISIDGTQENLSYIMPVTFSLSREVAL